MARSATSKGRTRCRRGRLGGRRARRGAAAVGVTFGTLRARPRVCQVREQGAQPREPGRRFRGREAERDGMHLVARDADYPTTESFIQAFDKENPSRPWSSVMADVRATLRKPSPARGGCTRRASSTHSAPPTAATLCSTRPPRAAARGDLRTGPLVVVKHAGGADERRRGSLPDAVLRGRRRP